MSITISYLILKFIKNISLGIACGLASLRTYVAVTKVRNTKYVDTKNCPLYKSSLQRVAEKAALREGFVVNEEEDKKDRVRSGEGDASDHIDGLRHADRVRRLFFADLDETWLKEINLQMNDGRETKNTSYGITIYEITNLIFV